MPCRRIRDHRRDATHDARLDDGLDEDEQAHEEEEGGPLDLAEHLVGVEPGDEHQGGRTEERDGRRLQPERRVGEESDDGQAHDDERPDEQAPVPDDGVLGGLEGRLPLVVRDLERAPEHHDHGHQEDAEDDQHDRSEVDQEVHEVETRGGTDEDVRRVADEGRGAADVGRQDLADEIRARRRRRALRATERVTGVISSTVVTLSRNADSPAVTRHRMMQQPERVSP